MSSASERQEHPVETKSDDKRPKTLMEAILAVQGELPKVTKDSTNPHFKSKYVSLDALMDAVLPVLNRNGLIWVTEPCRDDDRAPALRYRLVHVNTQALEDGADLGEWCEIKGIMALLAAKDDPQGQGAALTYARRFALTAVLGITADDDDDGNRAAQSKREAQQRQQEARDPNRPMPEDAIARMAQAAVEAELDLVELGAKAGVEEGAVPTVAQGKRIKELIEETEGRREEIAKLG